ncbi:MAG: hypothetical protein U9O94_07470 [Nanoarchaeota archaeon]|nr:hypothetical protein [Nanoarchaeota archaeon]
MKRGVFVIICLLVLTSCSLDRTIISETTLNYENLLELSPKYRLTSIYSENEDFQLQITPHEIWQNETSPVNDTDKPGLFEAIVIAQTEKTRQKETNGTTMENAIEQLMLTLEDFPLLTHKLCTFKKNSMNNYPTIRGTCEDNEKILFIVVGGPDINKSKEVVNEIMTTMTVK